MKMLKTMSIPPDIMALILGFSLNKTDITKVETIHIIIAITSHIIIIAILDLSICFFSTVFL